LNRFEFFQTTCRNRVANWVIEHLTYEKLKPADTDRGKSEFKEGFFFLV
jgi:hypothetical protein